VPEVRRLLRLLTAPAEQRGFLLHWSRWRRTHQAGARRGHVARRARAQPAPAPKAPGALGPPRTPLPAAASEGCELTDTAWAQIRALLPPPRPLGRPPRHTRAIVAALLWLTRTGASWRALPERFGPWHTVYSQYARWRTAGVWPHLSAALQAVDGAR
jgi:Putative transposase of IS4/5 family (DUF4096)